MSVAVVSLGLAGEIAPLLYRKWNEQDVERWFAWAEDRNARVILKPTTLDRLARMDLVPNEPFREAYEMAGRPDYPIKRELLRLEARDGVAYGSNRTVQSLRQHLGVELKYGEGGASACIFIDYRLAEACCKAMNLLPPECGV